MWCFSSYCIFHLMSHVKVLHILSQQYEIIFKMMISCGSESYFFLSTCLMVISLIRKTPHFRFLRLLLCWDLLVCQQRHTNFKAIGLIPTQTSTKILLNRNNHFWKCQGFSTGESKAWSVLTEQRAVIARRNGPACGAGAPCASSWVWGSRHSVPAPG